MRGLSVPKAFSILSHRGSFYFPTLSLIASRVRTVARVSLKLVVWNSLDWLVKLVAILSVITFPSGLWCIASSAAVTRPCGPAGAILQWLCPISFPTNTGVGSWSMTPMKCWMGHFQHTEWPGPLVSTFWYHQPTKYELFFQVKCLLLWECGVPPMWYRPQSSRNLQQVCQL